MMLQRSALLSEDPAVVHGFTTRHGGVSTGPLTSLNLARRGGETDAALDQNWARITAALGMPGAPVGLGSQTHGVTILDGDATTGAGRVELGEGDAIVLTKPGALIAVRVADCVPILLSAPGAVAAVHAGWRGTVAGIAERALAVLTERAGVPPDAVRAAIGPAIGPCCYEVGDEVVTALLAVAPEAIALRPGPRRPHADLRAVNEALLRAAGVRQVEQVGPCTRCSPDHYSHRREGEATGRFAGVIGLRERR
jgi:YfiH family protein